MTIARIYKPARNAMQSGKAKTKKWVLEFEPSEPKHLDPLMGWSGSGDTRAQVRLHFDTLEAAQAYAEEAGFDVEIVAPHAVKVHKKNYADRFAYDRVR